MHERTAQEREEPREPVREPEAAHEPARTDVARAVQAGAGNAAIARSVAARRHGGAPLPSGAAARALGPLASQVRVHTGPTADARLAARPGALAVTEGTDIHVGSGAPALDSSGGRLLLAHEAAHVLQQRAAGPAGADPEREADDAAVAAMLGRPLPALSAARGLLYFEARWHQASLTGAMESAGFSEGEQRQAYFANWCRDLSQALVPVVTTHVGPQAAFQVVNLLAMHHFGHGVTPAQLGSYDPQEHIDNPAATTDRDVLDQGVDIGGYGAAGHAGGPNEALYSPTNIADRFAVDESGIPEYIQRSRDYIKREVTAAIDAGRTAEGLFHVGNFSHTTEDLFAHSNWIEIAVARLLEGKQVKLPKGEARDEVAERLHDGRPPIENFAADVRDRAGRARPILSTGTFSGGGAGHDTLISIKAEAQNLLRDREPFKEDEGPNQEMADFVMEVLAHVDQASAEGAAGDILVEVVEQVTSGLAPTVGGALDNLPGQAREALGDGFFGDLAAGAAELLDEGAEGVADLAGDAWRAGLREVVRSAANSLGPAISFVEIARYLQRGAGAISRAWWELKEGVRALPDAIQALILPKLVEAEQEFKRRLRALANAAYGRAVELVVDELEGVAAMSDTAETNVGVKLEHWQEEFDELRVEMAAALEAVGSSDARALATQVRAMEPQQAIGFAQSPAFAAVLAGLTEEVALRVRSAGGSLDDKGNQVAQLENVPEWARGGASHSQIAKDHDDGAFFGIAFTVARKADGIIIELLQRTWAELGFGGPAAGLEAQFEAEAPDINEAERARRELFLATRAAGEEVLEHGHAETQDIGPRLVALADSMDAVIAAHPVLRPTLAGLTRLLRAHPDGPALEAEIRRVRLELRSKLQSGEIDDRLMATVDGAIGQVARLAGLHAHDHDFGMHHPAEHEGHEHGDRTEVFHGSQIRALDAHRGENAVAHASVREAVALAGRGGRRPAEAADAITAPRERLFAEIDRIFGHPYDSNWWVSTVLAWCQAHPEVLERSVRDRNAGVMHSHAH